MLTAFHEYVFSVNQISVDIRCLNYILPVKDFSRMLRMTKRESYNDAMHVSLLAGLAIPNECSPCKVDMDACFHQRLPQV